MVLKSTIRKSAEIGVSMTIIATLLAACGGGSGGGVANTGTTFYIIPALGKFKDGATVNIRDSKNNLCGTGFTAGGTAPVLIPSTCTGPFIVQAGMGQTDQYFDEGLNKYMPTSGVGINAVLPDTTRTSIGVTALTHIAAGRLITASGVSVNPATVTATNNAISALLSAGNVPDPLAVPMAADFNVKATDAYGAVLAALANLGANARQVAKDLAEDLADGSWDGFAGPTNIPANKRSTPDFSTFGASMVMATQSAVSQVNTTTPKFTFNSYLPSSNVIATITAATNSGMPPITTAKNMFTSLRTSLVLLTNPQQTGFFDTQLLAAKNDLRNTVMPKYQTTVEKAALVKHAMSLMQGLKAYGLPLACTPTAFMPCFGTYSMADPVTLGNIIVENTRWNTVRGSFMPVLQTCTSSSHPSAQYGTGLLPVLPAGITMSCAAEIDALSNAPAGYVLHRFTAIVTPAAAANNYSYTSTTTATPYDFMGVPGTPTVSALYIGTASLVGTPLTTPAPASQPIILANSYSLLGKLAADGVLHDYDQVAITALRTYPSGTAPAGSPLGFALAKYDISGSIASYLAAGLTPLGTITINVGTTESKLEDAYGLNPQLAADRNLGKTLTLMMQAKTTATQIDGTAYANAYACDISGIACKPTSLSFTGTFTNINPLTPKIGIFATGTLTDTRNLTAFNATLPASNTNRIKDNGSFTGTVTNNTVAPAAVYRITLNEDKMIDNQNTVSFIYIDSSNTTVNGNAIFNTTPAAPAIHTFNVSSGAVNGVLSRTPPALGSPALSGLTGNVYVGGTPAVPGTLIGTINNQQINYTDGTFSTLQ